MFLMIDCLSKISRIVKGAINNNKDWFNFIKVNTMSRYYCKEELVYTLKI